MKKILSGLLVCLMVLTIGSTVVFATNDCNFILTANKTDVKPGDTIQVVIKLDSNSGIAYYKNIMKFDSNAFERTTITYTNSDDEEVTEDIKSSWGSVTVNDAQAGKTIMVWSASANKTGKAVATLCYKVKDTAVNGTYKFSIECEAAQNASLNSVTIGSATSAEITVTGGSTGSTGVIVDGEDFTSATDGMTSSDVKNTTVTVGDSVYNMGENGKVYTFFKKTVDPLTAGSYGVKATIGGKEYKFPGKANVPANGSWVIKFIAPNGTFQDGTAFDVTSSEAYFN